MSESLFPEFQNAIKSLCRELEIDYEKVEFGKPSEDTETTNLYYKASGKGEKYGFDIFLSQKDSGSSVRMFLSVDYSNGARPFNFNCEPYGHSLTRWTDKAVYEFRLKHEPVILESLFNGRELRIFALPMRYSDPAFQDLAMVLDAIAKYQKETYVYRFRHISANGSYFHTDYSYAFFLNFKNHTRWAIFPNMGALQGGRSHSDFLETEDEINGLSTKIKVSRKYFDINWNF